jgi:hypothetical protein
MSNLVTATQLAAPAQPVSLSSLLAGLYALPTGTYCLGAAEDGLPVIRKPRIRATIATGIEGCGLLRLGHTAGATALRLSNQAGVSIVADLNLRYWPTENDARAFEPNRINNLIKTLQTWDAGNRHMLFILDDTAEDTWATPQVIEALTEHPAASVLVLARPEHAQSLIDALPEIFPVYGQGSQHLTQTAGIPADLAYGQFTIRHRSRWLAFTAVSQE